MHYAIKIEIWKFEILEIEVQNWFDSTIITFNWEYGFLDGYFNEGFNILGTKIVKGCLFIS